MKLFESIAVEADPSVPEGEVHCYLDGELVAKLVNIREPEKPEGWIRRAVNAVAGWLGRR